MGMNPVQIASDISSYFKDRWLANELNESKINAIRDYDRFTDQLQLEETQKALFFSNILNELASTY